MCLSSSVPGGGEHPHGAEGKYPRQGHPDVLANRVAGIAAIGCATIPDEGSLTDVIRLEVPVPHCRHFGFLLEPPSVSRPPIDNATGVPGVRREIKGVRQELGTYGIGADFDEMGAARRRLVQLIPRQLNELPRTPAAHSGSRGQGGARSPRRSGISSGRHSGTTPSSRWRTNSVPPVESTGTSFLRALGGSAVPHCCLVNTPGRRRGWR